MMSESLLLDLKQLQNNKNIPLCFRADFTSFFDPSMYKINICEVLIMLEYLKFS